MNMALDHALAVDFIPLITPTLVRPEIMDGTGFLGEHNDEVYYLPADDLYLTGTSEVALAGYHADEILDLSAGPLRYAGWSTCYRREAGSGGKDTRGILRVHQFNKLEMFSYVLPEDAEAEHDRLVALQEDMLQALGLSYRVIDVAAGDLGSSAARKFDIEAWVPTQGAYRELTSTSNCTTYQARRLDIRYRTESGKTAPGRDPQRHPGDDSVDRRAAGDASAGGRLGRGARGAAALPGRSRAARADSMTGSEVPWLVALDIDGTTLHEDGTISDAVIEQVHRLAAAGHQVMLATGRSASATLPVLDRLEITPRFLVCSNGAITLVRDPAAPTGYRREWVETFDPSEVLTSIRAQLGGARFAVEDQHGYYRYTEPFPDATIGFDSEHVEFEELLGARDPRRRDLARARDRGLPGRRREDGPAPGELQRRLDRLARHRPGRRQQGHRARARAPSAEDSAKASSGGRRRAQRHRPVDLGVGGRTWRGHGAGGRRGGRGRERGHGDGARRRSCACAQDAVAAPPSPLSGFDVTLGSP